MKKETFIKSTIILIIGGALTKILGMIIRIVMTRIVGSKGISLYMLIFPTFSLFMTLSQLSFPVAISKLVSEDRYNNKKMIFSIIPISFLINIFLMIIIIILAPFISNNLLHDNRCYYPILAIGLVLPFDSLSSILRGYFFGKQKMIPHVLSNIFEQIVRLVLIIIITPKLYNINIIYGVTSLVLVNVISEFTSIFVLFFFLPRNFKIKNSDLKIDTSNIKDILNIAIPTTGGRLIGSIGYFLEPIILNISFSISNRGNIFEYGIVEGYVMNLLLLPGFFTNAISSALLPIVSNLYYKKNISSIKSKLKLSIKISFFIGLVFTIIIILFPEVFLKFIYNTTLGVNYLRFLAPFFLIYYIQAPLASILQAINMSKYIMFDNLFGIIIKLIVMFILSIYLGIYGFLISMCVNILIVTISHYIHVKNALKKPN